MLRWYDIVPCPICDDEIIGSKYIRKYFCDTCNINFVFCSFHFYSYKTKKSKKETTDYICDYVMIL